MSHSRVWPLFQHWHFDNLSLAMLVAIIPVAIVVRRYRSYRVTLCISVAALLGVLLFASDVKVLAMVNYRAHMIEHLSVILVIAPLLAAATSVRWSKQLSTIGFLSFTGLVPLFHLTRLGGWVMQSPIGHDGELICFLLVGVAFWIPAYGAGRTLSDSQRLAYVLLALPIIALTGLVLWSSTSSSLSITNMNMSLISLNDIHGGGFVMMLWGTLAMVGHLLVLSITSAFDLRRRHQPVGHKFA